MARAREIMTIPLPSRRLTLPARDKSVSQEITEGVTSKLGEEGDSVLTVVVTPK